MEPSKIGNEGDGKEPLGFDRNLWNKFTTIKQYNGVGIAQLASVKQFAEGINVSAL
jgi:hypothetical protein